MPRPRTVSIISVLTGLSLVVLSFLAQTKGTLALGSGNPHPGSNTHFAVVDLSPTFWNSSMEGTYSQATSDDAFQAVIQAGDCDSASGEIVTELADATLPSGNQVGADNGQNAATSFVSAPIALANLTGSDHSIIIMNGGETAACGEVGGALNETGALVIVLREVNGSDVSGIAYLGANAGDPALTDVSLFVAGIPEPAPREVASQSDDVEESGPTPTPTFEEQVAGHVPLADVRDLAIRTGDYFGDQIIFSGTILSIGVAPEGRVFGLGDLDEQQYSAQMQVTVPAPDGTTEVVYVGYNGDTSGMFEGTWVTVYGTVVDYQSGVNRLGGQITQPLVAAEFVLIG